MASAFRTLNVSIPVSQKAWVARRLKTGGYGTVSAYIGELIRRDQREDERNKLAHDLVAALRARAPVESPLAARFGETVDLFDTAVRMVEARLMREQPGESDEQIRARVDAWLRETRAAPFEIADPERLARIVHAAR